MDEMDTIAYCGLFCNSCGVYIATQSDSDALEIIARKFNTTRDEMRCNGCRSDKLSPHCRNCDFRSCAQQKEIEFCEDCSEFPCKSISEFQKLMPHRSELFESTAYRKKYGLKKWLDKMTEDYSCKKCNTINSPYYLRCKRCGNEPGNDFIDRNLEKIQEYGKQ